MNFKVGAMVVAVVLASTPVMAEQLLVLESNGAELAQHTVLDSSDVITLSAGASLVLMTQSGEQINLEGPFSGVATPESNSENSSKLFTVLGALLQERKKVTTSIGAVRAATSNNLVSYPYEVTVGISGKFCYNTNIVVATEPNNDISFRNGVRRASAHTTGEKISFKPSQFGFNDGQEIKITTNGLSSDILPVKVELSGELIPDAIVFANNGCDNQAVAAVREASNQ